MRHVRIKARVPSILWDDVRECAYLAGCSLEDWTHDVCRDFARGKFGVTNLVNTEKGTRAESVTPWIKIPMGFDTALIRVALRSGVTYIRPKLFKPPVITFNGFKIGSKGEVSQ